MAVTPNGRPGDASPLAKPGYTGGRKLSDYERMIAHALMRKGKSKQAAIRMARGLLNKANKTGRWGDHGKAHAPTRAGAAASAAQRATFAVEDVKVLDFAKKRPGSMSNGKYPVTSAKSARSAYKLRNHGKGVSAAKVKAHIRAECKKRGIPIPKAMRQSDHSNVDDSEVDLARPFRYRHGWIPIGDVGRTKRRVADPAGRAKRNRTRAGYAAMREQSRRQARVGRRGRTPALPFTGSTSDELPFRIPFETFTGGARSQFAAEPVDDIELVAHWKHGWIPLNAEAAAIRAKMDAQGGEHPHAHGFTTLSHTPASYDEFHSLSKTEQERHLIELSGKVHQNARVAETATTRDLRSTVGAHGGEMDALKANADDPEDFRFKTAVSMQRKLGTKARQKGITPAEYASKIGDALRYTAVFPHESFTSGTKGMIDDLEKRGYSVKSLENTFHPGQAYSGINAEVTTPQGFTFELQFHTNHSIKTKTEAHHFYDVYRDADVYSLSERQRAFQQMMAHNSLLPRPEGWQTIGTIIHRRETQPGFHDNQAIRRARKELRKRGIPSPRQVA
jgi:hypothetical protein